MGHGVWQFKRKLNSTISSKINHFENRNRLFVMSKKPIQDNIMNNRKAKQEIIHNMILAVFVGELHGICG